MPEHRLAALGHRVRRRHRPADQGAGHVSRRAQAVPAPAPAHPDRCAGQAAPGDRGRPRVPPAARRWRGARARRPDRHRVAAARRRMGGPRRHARRGRQEASIQARDESAVRRAERRREAAEQAAARARAELVALQDRLDAATAEIAAERAEAAVAATAAQQARAAARRGRASPRATPTTGPRRRTKPAGRPARPSATRRRSEPPRPSASATPCSPTAPSAAAQRSRARRSASCASWPDRRAGWPTASASSSRSPRRRGSPLSLPGGVARDSRRAAEYLLRAPGALVLVDGYNVAKLGWPDEDAVAERQRCIDLVDDLARRFGSDIMVVFDGADVVGAHADRRRTVARPVLASAGDRRRRHPLPRRRRRRSSGRSSSSPTTSRSGATSRRSAPT